MNRHDFNAWVVTIALVISLLTIVGFVVLLCTGRLPFLGT